jgi:hypothetical protein
MPVSDWIDSMRWVYAPQVCAGASVATLRRRASYGGRKGRRAARRLASWPGWQIEIAAAFWAPIADEGHRCAP